MLEPTLTNTGDQEMAFAKIASKPVGVFCSAFSGEGFGGANAMCRAKPAVRMKRIRIRDIGSDDG